MKSHRPWIAIWITIISLGLLTGAFKLSHETHRIDMVIPEGWPAPTYDFAQNPVTKEGFELGKKLFFDPILSRDTTIACVNCHLPSTNFTHSDHQLSHGIKGRQGRRNTQSLVNLAWNKHFMWDGGVNHIEVQPIAPITNVNEMDLSLEELVTRLQNDRTYQLAFDAAFGFDTKISGQLILKGLSQYLLMLVSSDSKYDQVMRGDSGVTFSKGEENGHEVFQKHCTSCHPPPLFTTGGFANVGLEIDTFINDYGRMEITGRSEDSLMFKIPSLRNVQYSGPYMHDGRFRSLKQVVDHYTTGIVQSPTLAPELVNGVNLTDQEISDLKRFLRTLTDKTYLRNRDFWPEYVPPRDRK